MNSVWLVIGETWCWLAALYLAGEDLRRRSGRRAARWAVRGAGLLVGGMIVTLSSVLAGTPLTQALLDVVRPGPWILLGVTSAQAWLWRREHKKRDE
jgi:hypothetical protein